MNQEEIEDLQQNVKILESRLNNVNRSLDTLEEQVRELEEQNDMLLNELLTNSEKSVEMLSDVERILIKGWDSVSVRKSKNKDRAVELVREWEDISNVPTSNASTDNIATVRFKVVVENGTVGIENYANMERVAEYLEDMSNGKFVVEDSKGEHTVLVQREPIARDVSDLVGEE